jgi:competence protein ComX
MQEIVNFLVENPDVLNKVVSGEASILGVELDEVLGLVEGFMGSGKLISTYWW